MRLRRALETAARSGYRAWQDSGLFSNSRSSTTPLCLSGIVYTSIFNPIDHRKNWEDLLTGFLIALQNCEDATLVLKLINNQPRAIAEVGNYYRGIGIAHRCKVVFISSFLSDEQLVELANGTTYYITTTRAEGNCLPLMNYLAAGRPAISPCHTAMADYFNGEMGFVVDSHPEPIAYPQDPEWRVSTTWHRLVWTSLVEAIRESYAVAKQNPAVYQRLAQRARQEIHRWSSPQSVAPRLHRALELAAQGNDSAVAAAAAPQRLRAA
jgi:glycosyltransferase involved in cell wall biosynthesis